MGHCRNPRIGFEIVGGPDLVHHWLTIIDAWIALKGLHDYHQGLHGRLTRQFLNNPHRWCHPIPMDSFIILLVPVNHWLKQMCFGKLQQCLRWQQLSIAHTKFIRFLKINIILIPAYNWGRCLRWRYFAAHYWFQIWSKLTGSHCTIWYVLHCFRILVEFRMLLNNIASKSWVLRISRIILAFLVIWHLKHLNVIVKTSLSFWHKTFPVDMVRSTPNMKLTFVWPFEPWLKWFSYVLTTIPCLKPWIVHWRSPQSAFKQLLQNSNRWSLNNDPNHKVLWFLAITPILGQQRHALKKVWSDHPLSTQQICHGFQLSAFTLGVFLEFGTLQIVVLLMSCCELRSMPVMERIDLFVWSDWQLVVRRMLPFSKEAWFLSIVPTYFVTSFVHKRRNGGALRSHLSRLTHVAVEMTSLDTCLSDLTSFMAMDPQGYTHIYIYMDVYVYVRIRFKKCIYGK